jgi:ABC-2 type transport system permease protein
VLHDAIHNFPALLRFALKRDRVWLGAWILGLLLLGVFFAPMLPGVAGNAAELAAMRQTMESPMLVSMTGMLYGDTYTYGVMLGQTMLTWMGLIAGIMNVFLVIRHTRKDEESERLDLILALPVGKTSTLFAVMLEVIIANLVIALLTGVGLAALQVESIYLGGSMLYGTLIGLCGILSAALAAIFAQLASTSRAATGLSILVLGVFFLMRAVGDVGNEALACISPLGLIERSELFVGNYLWPSVILIIECVALFPIAFWLNGRRDLGQGLIPTRKGRSRASFLLNGTWNLAFRLVRTIAFVWIIVAFALSAAYGSVFGSIEEFLNSSELFQAVIGVSGAGTMADYLNPMVATLQLIMGIIATVSVVTLVLHLKTEEGRGRLEQVYANSVSRTSTLLAYIVMASVLAFIVQLTNALGMWIASCFVLTDPLPFIEFLKTSMNLLPALLLFVGLAAFFIGVIPRLAGISWAFLGYSFLVVYLGGMLNMPKWAEAIAPFSAVARYPVEQIEAVPLAVLLGLYLLLCGIGLITYRRRDLKTG